MFGWRQGSNLDRQQPRIADNAGSEESPFWKKLMCWLLVAPVLSVLTLWMLLWSEGIA